MDFITDHPEVKGLNTILVVVDRLPKMAHFIALKDLTTAAKLAHIFFQKFFVYTDFLWKMCLIWVYSSWPSFGGSLWYHAGQTQVFLSLSSDHQWSSSEN